MMYRPLHMDRKILSLFVVCGSLFVSTSHLAYASNSNAKSPALKTSNTGIPSFISHFYADKMGYAPDELILTAKGNVEIHRDNVVLKADEIEYNQKENRLLALGNVTILEFGGKVAFFDKVELKNGIKEAIVNKFKAQMIDNDVFMDAEERKPSEHVANYAANNNKKSLFDKISNYLTTDFLTASNTRAGAESLSNLAPAAGDNVATLDNKPVIGNIPLIALPDTQLPTTSEATTAATNPATPAPAVTAPPPAIAEPANPIEDEQSKPPIKVADAPLSPAVTPLLSPPKEAEDKKGDEKKTIEDIVTNGTVEEAKKEPAEKIEEKAAARITEKTEASIKKEDKPQEKTYKAEEESSLNKNAKTKEVDDKAPIKAASASEPDEALSPKSRELLGKIKLPAKSEKESTNPFKIERTHGMQDLFKNESTALGTEADALGVKVDKKKGPPINVEYELEKAYNATISGQNEAAIATYQEILDNSPNNTQALFGLATLYHRAKQLDKARSLYGRLLAIDPDHRDGFNNFLVLLADEAPREALVELEKLEAKNPGFSTIPAQIAVIYQKLGDFDKAIDKMFRAVALSPENLTYRYNLAIMLDKQKNYDEATKLYKQLVEASDRGEKIPGNISNIQQRLTFISSNRP
jgi:Flp pilus assembly protein TadD